MANRIANVMKLLTHMDVDAAVLGAFGCGAFENDVQVVARAFKQCVSSGICCKEVVFAIYKGGENMKAFQAEFK